jgi:hypothetical protein
VPHALAALELAAGECRQPAPGLDAAEWADLRRDLAGFVRKHDHRNREPFTEAEAGAYLRAIEALHGQAGLFANDLRGLPRSERRASPQRASE